MSIENGESFSPKINKKRSLKIGNKATLVGAGALLVAASQFNVVPTIGDLLHGGIKGGKSEPVPHGDIIYKGQKAESVSAKFKIEVGKGDAVFAVKAKQDWDTPGGIFSGDFQATNGTAFVSDPKDHSKPAMLHVETRYCADGYIEKDTLTDQKTKKVTENVVFHVGKVMLCDAKLAHTAENFASFRQDDTPSEFQGNFDYFVTGAAEEGVKAAPCPTEELSKYTSSNFNNYAAGVLSTSMNVPLQNIKVVGGTIGETDQETKNVLREHIESYANKKDPKHPKQTFPALDISYLASEGTAIDQSCYEGVGAVDISTLGNFNPNKVLSQSQG